MVDARHCERGETLAPLNTGLLKLCVVIHVRKYATFLKVIFVEYKTATWNFHLAFALTGISMGPLELRM